MERCRARRRCYRRAVLSFGGTSRKSRRIALIAAIVAYSAAVAVTAGSMRVAGVVAPIAFALILGARRGFAARQRPTRAHSGAWVAAWVATIAVLIAFELWQVTLGTTTVTSLVMPLLAIPALRIVAIAAWLSLGWRLAS